MDGDEYERSMKKRLKDEATGTATMEIYRSLDTLPIEHKVTLKNAIEDALLCGSVLGYPMVSTRVKVLDGRWSNLRSKNPVIF